MCDIEKYIYVCDIEKYIYYMNIMDNILNMPMWTETIYIVHYVHIVYMFFNITHRQAIQTHNTKAHTHTHTHARTHARTHAHTHTQTHTRTHTHTFARDLYTGATWNPVSDGQYVTGLAVEFSSSNINSRPRVDLPISHEHRC